VLRDRLDGDIVDARNWRAWAAARLSGIAVSWIVSLAIVGP
jgi:hypothetical protein